MARFTPVVFWTLGAATALQSARRRAVVARATRDDAGSSFAFAPALSLGKWETMQARGRAARSRPAAGACRAVAPPQRDAKAPGT